LMIILRNLPMRWWLPAIALYSIRVGFALDTSSSLVGFYVDHWGWQWLYWQGALIAPLMGLMVYLGTPDEILIAGKLADVADEIHRRRAEARRANGWIMDTYVMRRPAN